MPKLAIYVPKKDMREIEKWRREINFSKVFMHALGQEIRQRSRRRKSKDNQDQKGKLCAAAAFYRNELADCCEPLEDFGYQRGKDDVMDCQLSAATIAKLVALKGETLDDEQTTLVATAMSDAGRDIDQFCDQQGFDKSTFPTRHQALCRGFVLGVADAWEEVCQHMQTNRSD